jgi:hypothetical protein
MAAQHLPVHHRQPAPASRSANPSQHRRKTMVAIDQRSVLGAL